MRARRFHVRLGDTPRIMPIAPMVRALGYLPNKSEWMRYESHNIVFCFILRGQGRLHNGNRWYTIKAPCVLAQWPGVHEEYGPTPEGGTWDELFLSYSLSLAPTLDAWGIHPAQQPVWPIASVRTVRRLIEELSDYIHQGEGKGLADRVDRIAQRLLLESWLEQPAAPKTPYDEALDRARGQLTARPDLSHDLKALARECGMAEVTFRRYWKRRFGLPFKHDLINLRMQEACRLLVQTKKGVKEIAAAVGFMDSHYFSHRFTTLIGMPATEYRTRFSVDQPEQTEPPASGRG